MIEPTRPSILSHADIERIVSALSNGSGASIKIQDQRVSQVQTWLLGLVGAGLVVSLAWMANSIDSLNRTVERNNAQLEYMDRRIARLEESR